MDVKNLNNELGLSFVRQEGNELIYKCPDCGKDKLYVNKDTGAWQCFHGCGEGYPYQLAKKLKPDMEARDIFELCGRYGAEQGGSEGNRSVSSKPKKVLIYKKEDVRPPTEEELNTFCAAKCIDKEALLTFQPLIDKKRPWILLPAFDPGSNKAVGFIRVGLNGQLIPIKYKENGVWKEKLEKYPVAKGSSPGLLGLPKLAQDGSDSIIFAEGWKDALAARQAGYAATCGSQGAKTWRDEWQEVFKDKVVYIVFDRDIAGVNGAAKAAKKICEVAKEIYIVELPYDLTETNGKDLYDYLVTDKHDDLNQLLSSTPAYSPPPSSPPGTPEFFDNQSEQADQQGVIVLADDHPDTVAASFEQRSVVPHKYNSYDGWSIYHNSQYQAVTDPKEIRLHIRKHLSKCRTTKKDKICKMKRKTSGFVSDVLESLAAMDNVHLLPGQKAPCSLDGTMDTNYTIALQNGLLDWSKHPYTLHDLTEQCYTLNYLPFNWNGENDSDLWIDFLVEVTGGNEDLHNLLQQWAGYCLMKHNQKEQRFMIVYGEAGTGKSVFLDILTHLLGKENVSAIPLDRFDDPHYVIQTYGKMLNATDESERQLEETIESHIKHYTGGTMYTFKRLYQESFSAYPTAKIMIITNHLPAFKDTSDGVWRRLLIAPFDYIIPENKIDRNLASKIIETEMPGVLSWALQGARMIEKYGFIVPEICKKVLAEYRREAIPEIAFFEENFEPCDPDEIGGKAKCDTVRNCYESWCQAQGVGIKSNKNLAKTMKKLFPLCERKRERDRLGLAYFYCGIKMTEDSEFIGKEI